MRGDYASRASSPTDFAVDLDFGRASIPAPMLRNHRILVRTLNQGVVMNPTRNDLKESVRKQMADLLNGCLVELIDLGMQAKQAHWNVKGPSFIALHELFDKVAEAVEEAVDTVAERAVALGGVATGTVQLVNERSELTPYSLKLKGGEQHVKALSMALAMCGRRVRAAIETATKAGDQGTADVFTEVSRALDQYLWYVEAHAGAKD